MVDVRDDYQRFQQAGAEVAVIAQAKPGQVEKFRQSMKLPFACFSDESRSAYKAYHIARASFRQMMAPSVMAAGPKALFRGGLRVPQGDVKQMPGSFVIDTQGIVCLAYYSKTIADNPSNDRLIAALPANT